MRRLLVALLLPAGLAHAAPARPAAHVAQLIQEWRIAEAASEATALLQQQPEDPEALLLDGEVKFLSGAYESALQRLDAGLRQGGAGAGLAEARGLRELVAGAREVTRDFREARSPGGHFIVRYPPGRDEILLPYAFTALEAAYQEVGVVDFGDAPAAPVLVEIYGEVADLARVSTLTEREIETSGTIALCKWNRLMIVSPRAVGRGYPWLDTLTHEYTHLVVSRASRNHVPIWLHEGLAKFEERRWRRPAGDLGGLTPTLEHLLASALHRGRRLITFAEMHPSMARLPSQADTALAFAEVWSAVAFLHERHGWAGVRAVVARLRDGATDAAAISALHGGSWEDFQRDWRAWLRGRRLRERPGLVPSSLKFVKAKLGRGAKEEDETQEIAEERGRRLARLGGLLRARGRLSPAAVEYQKALLATGPGHPIVANKLARTWLELGDADKAIATAEPAVELYPDHAAFHATLGEAWLKKQRLDRATPHFEAAIHSSPFDPGPHCALAAIYGTRGDTAAAARERLACGALGGDQ